ncbi:methyltransferase-like protein 27 [Diadema antillarum]|uniref:methyltransferase-like protein 27 n=1 Tax=Diadema antillarum TaxID=105358 RepID=UPI003A89D007
MAEKFDFVYRDNFKQYMNLELEKRQAFYDDWVQKGDYDKDVLEQEYFGPRLVAKKMNEVLNNKDAKILDVGAGTGLVGEELVNKYGFKNLTGVDPSRPSLDIARSKGVYKELIESFVGPQPLPPEDNSFDAAISSGAFLPAHCDGSSLKDVVRLVKPGGLILIAVRRFFMDEVVEGFYFKEAVESLVTSKTCSLEVDYVSEYAQGQDGAILILTNLTGVDPSRPSLDIARSKGFYKELLEAFVGPQPLPLEDSGLIVIALERDLIDGGVDGFDFKEVVESLVSSQTCSLERGRKIEHMIYCD